MKRRNSRNSVQAKSKKAAFMNSDDEYSGGDEEYDGLGSDEDVDYDDDEMFDDPLRASGPSGKSDDKSSSGGNQKGGNGSNDYDVFSRQRLQESVQDMVDEVKGLLDVDDGTATSLLLRNKWDKDTLVESYFAGLSESDSQPESKKRFKPDTAEIECAICMTEAPVEETFTLPACGHTYCNDCWTYFVKNKLEEGANCITATCPYPKCPTICPGHVWKKYLTPTEYQRYSKYLLDSIVTLSPKYKWCPSPGCECCIKQKAAVNRAAECECGFRFCFKCNDHEIGDHAPADCEETEQWLKKASDESENMNWLVANTKKCPKCRAHIEKNGGCMHMTCGTCRYEFCWLCRGDWKGHRSCNKSTAVVDEERRALDAKTELEHYMFYYHRYESHRNAMKIADQQRKTARQRAEDLMVRFEVRHQDVTFMMAATEQLLRNRNILQYSYVYAFYLSKKRVRSAEKNLFEYLQNDLEHHTDELSALYERDVDSLETFEQFMKWKEGVTNYTRVCKKFLDSFIEGVVDKTLTHAEGLEMSEDERYFIVQLEQLAAMGFPDRSMTLPLIIQFDGNIEAVMNALFG